MAKLTTKLQGNQESVFAKELRETVARSADDARPSKKGCPEGLGSQRSRGDVAKGLVANAGKSPTLSTPLAMANQEPCCNKIANNVPTNKKMDDRVKKGEQLNAEGRRAVRARYKQKQARGNPQPKRGAVKKAIAVDMKEGVKAGVKKLTDTGRAFCCAPKTFDVDAFVEGLPVPTRIETTATLWDKVEI